jgi:hypothetical protein
MSAIKYALFFVADIVLIGCLASYFYMAVHNPLRLVVLDPTEGRFDNKTSSFAGWNVVANTMLG